MTKKHYHRRFSRRDRTIVEMAARYRLLTKDVIHRVHFDATQPTAVTKVTRRLCEEGWLNKFPLVYPSQYLVPGIRAAQLLGLPSSRTLPLGPQSLPTEFAVLQYATERKNIRRATSEELLNLKPWFHTAWAGATHCIRRSADNCVIELLRVDLGGPPDHVARKCYADIQSRIAVPKMEQLILSCLFRSVILTATTDKAAAIQRALAGHLWPSGLQFHFAVIPQLLSLVPRCTEA